MLSNLLLETSTAAASVGNDGASGLPGQIVLFVLFVVLILQLDITRTSERDNGGKAHWLLGVYVIPLLVACAVVLGGHVALLLFGG